MQETEAPRPVRIAARGRLAYYRAPADAEYWDSLWEQTRSDAIYRRAREGDLGRFEDAFTRYLPRDRPVLEAGCGLGDKVLALHVRGYDVEGVDSAARTVEKVRTRFPELRLASADVCALPVADGHYGGYISLGVIEHREAGPGPFLEEAYRVLAPDGVALFSVPWFNPVRRVKGILGAFRGPAPHGRDFYQYAYRGGEVRRYLRAAGFQVREQVYFNPEMGFEDELPCLKGFYEIGAIGQFVKRAVRRCAPLVKRVGGHSILYICYKRRAHA